jgi:hypothetical protein
MLTGGNVHDGGVRSHQIGDDAKEYNLKTRNASSRNHPGLPADPCPSAKARRTAKVMYFKRLAIFRGAIGYPWRYRMPYPDPGATDISYAT